MFSILTLVTVVGSLLCLSYRTFCRKTEGIVNLSHGSRIKTYLSYLSGMVTAGFGLAGRKPILELAEEWAGKRYPGWRQWVFFGLILSYVFLAFTGFAFSIFSTRGLYGLLLLLHVVGGGIYAVSLSIMVVLRARDYSFATLRAGIPSLLPSFFFWIFILSGLSLIVTALNSMLPFFSFNTQLGIKEFHRYSALVSLLSAIAFVYFSLDGKE